MRKVTIDVLEQWYFDRHKGLRSTIQNELYIFSDMKYITLSQFIKVMGVGEKVAREWVSNELISIHRFKNRIFINKDVVDRLIFDLYGDMYRK
ncbi:MAG: hypothetical protein HQ521_05230 [Bacteroidetes bacterium]|nr:hypothetical protein [Bacteroidota bacterium]